MKIKINDIETAQFKTNKINATAISNIVSSIIEKYNLPKAEVFDLATAVYLETVTKE